MSENTEVKAVSLKKKIMKVISMILFITVTAALWTGSAALMLGTLVFPAKEITAENIKTDLATDFDNMLGKKLSGVGELNMDSVKVKKNYTLNDLDKVAPEPNPARYGTASSAKELEQILLEAEDLLDGQETLFTTDTQIMKGSKITYYLDDTILAITWKQPINNCVYTFSEVKIAHASQFRRFLADGQYGATTEYTTQEMATSVNAVVASSGDYYGYRYSGVCVNEGIVYRNAGAYMDTCFIDDNGDLIFAYQGELTDKETTQKFVDDNNLRFSISFGPVIILDGEYVVPYDYYVGEINDEYSRAALCQLGPLHYMVVAANYEGPYYRVNTMYEFTWNLIDLGITKAYALDGGQTAAIVMNDKLINQVSYGAQREISDIIYFATAIPVEDWE